MFLVIIIPTIGQFELNYETVEGWIEELEREREK